MKLIKLSCLLICLTVISNTGWSQNWGFSLPFGNGGFAINGKNWTAGLGGAVVGGGRSGWGFQLPNGAGFYNGGGPGMYGGVVPMGYGGGYGGAPCVGYGGPVVYPNPNLMDRRMPYRDVNGWVRRGPPPVNYGQIVYPNVW